MRRDQAILENLSQPQTQTFLEQSHAVHFGCHGEFDDRNPLNAYLRLTNLSTVLIFPSVACWCCRLAKLAWWKPPTRMIMWD
ncbi:hypothetical protein NIES39_A05800 [Arthrospira platensis NIES-39]|nr:hypothetical protein NIES39_A05800 [Arthrospira platensis NIES-39]